MKITTIPQVYRNVNRWREILSILSKYGLANWVSRFDLAFAKGLLKNRDGEVLARHTRETRIRLAIEELGPVFIKLGQILSTRPDLVGAALAKQLTILQTDVPADPADVVRATVERELGQSVDELFAEFDETPLASASIGQVHHARLASGTEVAVKIQHHDIRDRVRVDMDILAGLAQLAERIPELVNYRPSSTAAEFQRALRRELDFTREARNLEEIAHRFAGRPEVHIPRVDAELSTSRVLTMEFLHGAKVADAQRTGRALFNSDRVARRCAEIYLQMIFQDGFYHADPHPGNLVVMKDDVVGLLDFGMVGRLDAPLREDIEEMLLAVVGQDPEQLTTMITRVGAVPPSLDESNLRMDVADFVGHYAHLPLDSLDLGAALSEMVELVRRYHVMLPPPMAMLLKALIMLEGTGRLLSPRFSLMEVMEPHHRRMMIRRRSPMRHLKKMRRIGYEIEQLAELLPRRIREILQQVESGKFDVHLDHRGLEPSVNRLVLGLLASALFLGSSLLMSQRVWPFYGASVPGVMGCVLSLLLGVRLLRAINKSGHLDRHQ